VARLTQQVNRIPALSPDNCGEIYTTG